MCLRVLLQIFILHKGPLESALRHDVSDGQTPSMPFPVSLILYSTRFIMKRRCGERNAKILVFCGHIPAYENPQPSSWPSQITNVLSAQFSWQETAYYCWLYPCALWRLHVNNKPKGVFCNYDNHVTIWLIRISMAPICWWWKISHYFLFASNYLMWIPLRETWLQVR